MHLLCPENSQHQSTKKQGARIPHLEQSNRGILCTHANWDTPPPQKKLMDLYGITIYALTGQSVAENPSTAIITPSQMKGTTLSPSLESRYRALSMLRACTQAGGASASPLQGTARANHAVIQVVESRTLCPHREPNPAASSVATAGSEQVLAMPSREVMAVFRQGLP